RFLKFTQLPDIVILCDTRCNMEDHFSIPQGYLSFSSFYQGNPYPKRGVTLLIKSTLNPKVQYRCAQGNIVKAQ
ncbi:Hypothetical protein FKW44_014948, partial [Caligus rogercresseyi]